MTEKTPSEKIKDERINESKHKRYRYDLRILVIILVTGFCMGYAFSIYVLPQLEVIRMTNWEDRCKVTLRSIASKELYYWDSSAESTYGTFEALQTKGYIPADATRSDMIDQYNLAVFNVDPPTMTFNGLPAYDSTFTIIAIPKDQSNNLRTFGISEDQELKVFNNDNTSLNLETSNLQNEEYWEPHSQHK